MKQALGKNINVNFTDRLHSDLENAKNKHLETNQLLLDSHLNRKIELQLILNGLEDAETMQDIQSVIDGIKDLLGRS